MAVVMNPKTVQSINTDSAKHNNSSNDNSDSDAKCENEFENMNDENNTERNEVATEDEDNQEEEEEEVDDDYGGPIPSDEEMEEDYEHNSPTGIYIEGTNETSTKKSVVLNLSNLSVSKGSLQIYKCPLCEYNTITLKYFRRHLRQHDAQTLHCPYCLYKTKIKYHMERHVKSHTGAGSVKCKYCPFESVRPDVLRGHMRIHNPEVAPLFSCKQCSFSSNKNEDLRWHSRTHSEQKVFSCTECNYSTIRKGHMNRHMNNHCKKLLQCPCCDFNTTRTFLMSKHIAYHKDLGEELFSCTDCFYYTSKSAHFRRHLDTHKHKCHMCSFTSSREELLQKHLQFHKKGGGTFASPDIHGMKDSGNEPEIKVELESESNDACTQISDRFISVSGNDMVSKELGTDVHYLNCIKRENNESKTTLSPNFSQSSVDAKCDGNLKAACIVNEVDEFGVCADLDEISRSDLKAGDGNELEEVKMGRNAPRKSKTKFKIKFKSMFPSLISKSRDDYRWKQDDKPKEVVKNTDKPSNILQKKATKRKLLESEHDDTTSAEQKPSQQLKSSSHQESASSDFCALGKQLQKKEKSVCGQTSHQQVPIDTCQNASVSSVPSDRPNTGTSVTEKTSCKASPNSKDTESSNVHLCAFSCKLCTFTTTTRKYLNRHLRRHYKTATSLTLKCHTCSFTTTDAILLRSHIEEHIFLHSCPLCKFRTSEEEDLNSHMAIHLNEKTVGGVFRDNVNPGVEEVSCANPSKDIQSDDSQDEDQSIVHSNANHSNNDDAQNVTCYELGNTLSDCNNSNAAAAEEVQEAVGEETVPKQLSSQAMANFMQLLLVNKNFESKEIGHLVKEEPDNTSEDVINATAGMNLLPNVNASQLPLYTQLSLLANMSMLNTKLALNTDEEVPNVASHQGSSGDQSLQEELTPDGVIFSCGQCTYSTNRKDHLLRHFNQHTGKGMQYCPHCPYSTVRKEHMKRHIKLHTEGVLKCAQCDFTTRRKEQMRLHMLSHLAKDHLKCIHCSYITVRKEHMKRHLSRHALDRVARCRFCHYTTDRRERMQKHVDTLHSLEGEVEDVFKYIDEDDDDDVDDDFDEDQEKDAKIGKALLGQEVETADGGAMDVSSCAGSQDSEAGESGSRATSPLCLGEPHEADLRDDASDDSYSEACYALNFVDTCFADDNNKDDEGIALTADTDKLQCTSVRDAARVAMATTAAEDCSGSLYGGDNGSNDGATDSSPDDCDDNGSSSNSKGNNMRSVTSKNIPCLSKPAVSILPSSDASRNMDKLNDAKTQKKILVEQHKLIMKEIKDLLLKELMNSSSEQQQQLLALQQLLQQNQLNLQKVECLLLQLQKQEQQTGRTIATPGEVERSSSSMSKDVHESSSLSVGVLKPPPPLKVPKTTPKIPQSLSCSHCSYTAAWNDKLLRHIRCKHAEVMARHPVDRCSYRTTRKERLGVHLRNHALEKRMRCNTCSYETVRRHHMKRHILRKHKGVCASDYCSATTGDSDRSSGENDDEKESSHFETNFQQGASDASGCLVEKPAINLTEEESSTAIASEISVRSSNFKEHTVTPNIQTSVDGTNNVCIKFSPSSMTSKSMRDGLKPLCKPTVKNCSVADNKSRSDISDDKPANVDMLSAVRDDIAVCACPLTEDTSADEIVHEIGNEDSDNVGVHISEEDDSEDILRRTTAKDFNLTAIKGVNFSSGQSLARVCSVPSKPPPALRCIAMLATSKVSPPGFKDKAASASFCADSSDPKFSTISEVNAKNCATTAVKKTSEATASLDMKACVDLATVNTRGDVASAVDSSMPKVTTCAKQSLSVKTVGTSVSSIMGNAFSTSKTKEKCVSNSILNTNLIAPELSGMLTLDSDDVSLPDAKSPEVDDREYQSGALETEDEQTDDELCQEYDEEVIEHNADGELGQEDQQNQADQQKLDLIRNAVSLLLSSVNLSTSATSNAATKLSLLTSTKSTSKKSVVEVMKAMADQTQCPLCPFTSSWRVTMNRHIRRHLDPLSDLHQCPHCTYKTYRSDHMRNHMTRHTGQGYIECPGCTYKTGRKDHMKRHRASCKGCVGGVAKRSGSGATTKR